MLTISLVKGPAITDRKLKRKMTSIYHLNDVVSICALVNHPSVTLFLITKRNLYYNVHFVGFCILFRFSQVSSSRLVRPEDQGQGYFSNYIQGFFGGIRKTFLQDMRLSAVAKPHGGWVRKVEFLFHRYIGGFAEPRISLCWCVWLLDGWLCVCSLWFRLRITGILRLCRFPHTFETRASTERSKSLKHGPSTGKKCYFV